MACQSEIVKTINGGFKNKNIATRLPPALEYAFETKGWLSWVVKS